MTRSLFLALAFSLVSVSAFAEGNDEDFANDVSQETSIENDLPANVLQADVGSGVVGLGYERVLVPWLSARLTVALNRPWYTDIFGGPETDVGGFGVELRPMVFPFGEAPGGFYVSVFGRVVPIRATDDAPEEVTGAGWTAGATVGYGWLVLNDALLIRLGVGAQYWAFELDAEPKNVGVEGFYPDIDAMVGWAF